MWKVSWKNLLNSNILEVYNCSLVDMVNFVFSFTLLFFLLDETWLMLFMKSYYLSFCHGLWRLVDFLSRWKILRIIRHHIFSILRWWILMSLTAVSILRLWMTLLIHRNSSQKWFLRLFLFLILQWALKSVVIYLVELIVRKQVDRV